MQQQKILVLGGSGFIGTVLVTKLLQAGQDVRIIDKRISQEYPDITIQCDVRNAAALVEACQGYDTIYNLAAEHKDNVTPRSLYDEVNVQGAHNTCRAAEQCGIKKIIFTSSVAVYGFTRTEADESHPLQPFNDYGRTKMEAEVVYHEWLTGGQDRSLVIVRPSVVFGVENRGNVYNLLKQIASHRFIMVGSGRNHKSMVYVENVAEFLKFALQFDTGEHLFNYVDKPDFDMNSLVKLVKKNIHKPAEIGLRIPYFLGYLGGLGFDLLSLITRKKFPISAIRVKKFCADTLFAAQRVQASGFTPPVAITTGLEKTIKAEFGRD